MKILFCINVHLKALRAVGTQCWLVCSTDPVMRVTVHKEDWESSVGLWTTPLAPLSLLSRKKKKAHIVAPSFLPSFPSSFLETRWLCQMEFYFLVTLCFG